MTWPVSLLLSVCAICLTVMVVVAMVMGRRRS